MPQNLPSSERGDFESLVPAGDLPKPSCGGCDVVSTILSTIVLDTAVKNGFLGPSIRYHANSLKPFNEVDKEGNTSTCINTQETT